MNMSHYKTFSFDTNTQYTNILTSGFYMNILLLYKPNTDESDQEETYTLIPNTFISLEKLYKFNNKKGSDQVNIYTLTLYVSTLDVRAIVSYALELYEPNADEFDQINAYTSISYASTLLGDHILDELNTNELDQDDTISSISCDSILSDSSDIQVVVLW
ncbi:37567_t:CDS:2 [Gigaspora margarita]|uniref:37567_t:CDS:1 n=1 Tax=Gigaspora margarita TaxID=4874 RepID=A0ABN7V9T4_GIGMA|nr:37567_t:CDS:2 [Gigaspora margarita]